MKLKKSLLINIGVLFVTVLLILIIWEVVLQVRYVEPPPVSRWVFSPELGWENAPGYDYDSYGSNVGRRIHTTHNSLGFRDAREFGPKTKPRIVVFGDSFVYGTGIDQDQMITRKLQEWLPEYEVIPVGTIGYSTAQYLMAYEARVRPLDPDIVVFALIINDFAENYFTKIFGFDKPKVPQISANGTLEWLPNPQTPREFPYNPGSRPLLLLPKYIKDEVNKIKDFYTLREPYADHQHRFNQAFMLLETPMIEQAKYSISLEALVLQEAKQTIEGDDVTFVVTFIPSRIQTDPHFREVTLRRYSDIDRFNFDWLRINLIIRQMCQQLGIDYYDYTDAILALDDPADAYAPDGHLGPYGTELFDKTLLEHLQEQGYIS